MAKTAREKTDRRKTSPRRPAGAQPPGVSAEDIARRAFEVYCARGGGDGRDVDDWLQAEQELRISGDRIAG